MAKWAVAMFAAPEVLNVVSTVFGHLVSAEPVVSIPDRWKPAVRLIGLVLALFAKSLSDEPKAEQGEDVLLTKSAEVSEGNVFDLPQEKP